MYRSPSQTTDEFALFKHTLDLTLSRVNNYSPYLTLLLGDFNARNSAWWENDTTNMHGIDIHDLALRNGMTQLIDEPTHILPNSSSCIDLIFSNATNAIVDSCVLPSLYSACHHSSLSYIHMLFLVLFYLYYATF